MLLKRNQFLSSEGKGTEINSIVGVPRTEVAPTVREVVGTIVDSELDKSKSKEIIEQEFDSRVREADRLYLKKQLEESDSIMQQWQVILDEIETKQRAMEQEILYLRNENMILRKEVLRLQPSS